MSGEGVQCCFPLHSSPLLCSPSLSFSQLKLQLQASILLFHGSTLEAVRRIESNAAGFTGLQFSQDSSQLLAATADRRLLTYATDGMATDYHAPLAFQGCPEKLLAFQGCPEKFTLDNMILAQT